MIIATEENPFIKRETAFEPQKSGIPPYKREGIHPLKQKHESSLNARERRVAEARALNLFSDTFLSVALNDAAACQHVLRILTGIPDLTVKEIRTQYRISNITSHDAILDVFAEDSKGKLYNIEIQRKDTVDHARRTRFYTSMIDSESLAKGTTYAEMPDVYIVYISETDLWHLGKTVCPVRKFFDGTRIPYEDGIHILYVNAAVDDGSNAAKLMRYFRTSDPRDMSQGALSRRIHFLKQEEGGYQIMCDISEKWFKEGEETGSVSQAKKTAYNMAKAGLPIESIASFVDFSIETVARWLSEQPVPENGKQ